MVADVQAPASPTENEKTTMTHLVASQPVSFDKQQSAFGTVNGMSLLSELQAMKEQIGE